MTEKKRSASEIRAYCEAASDGPWVTGPEGAYWPIVKYQPDLEGICKYRDILSAEAGNADNNADFIVNARIDLLRLLETATGLYAAFMWLVAQKGRKLTEHEALELGSYLNGLTWLAEGPVPEGPLARAWREACSRESDDHELADGKLHDGISTTGQGIEYLRGRDD